MVDITRTVRSILKARVYPAASVTPTQVMPMLSRETGHDVRVKREDLQSVFSFKIRGAANKISGLDAQELKRGVIAASAGNHAQGVAVAAAHRKTSALIVMPRTTSDIKVKAVRAYGAEVNLFGDTFHEALREAQRRKKTSGRVFVHPYDDPAVIAGQGTVGIEIIRQVDAPIEAIFVPVGGGGLLAGVSAYVKYIHPQTKVIGVECDESACLTAALAAGRRVSLKSVGIFADGIAVSQVGRYPFEILRDGADEVMTVTSDEICSAIRDLFLDTRSIAEPAGAVALAGLKRYAASHPYKGQSLVAIESGANVDFNVLRYISERAEIGEGREGIFSLRTAEKPGRLRAFCLALGDHDVTFLNYRRNNAKEGRYLIGVAFANGRDGRSKLLKRLRARGHHVSDVTDNEIAKTHVKHMIGGRPEGVVDEFVAEFSFPERPGALRQFLDALGDEWNLTLFHYRKQGGEHARVLAGIETGGRRRELIERLRHTGFPFIEQSKNAVFRDFLTGGPDSRDE